MTQTTHDKCAHKLARRWTALFLVIGLSAAGMYVLFTGRMAVSGRVSLVSLVDPVVRDMNTWELTRYMEVLILAPVCYIVAYLAFMRASAGEQDGKPIRQFIKSVHPDVFGSFLVFGCLGAITVHLFQAPTLIAILSVATALFLGSWNYDYGYSSVLAGGIWGVMVLWILCTPVFGLLPAGIYALACLAGGVATVLVLWLLNSSKSRHYFLECSDDCEHHPVEGKESISV